MQFTEYKLVPLVRGILTSALPLFLREIVADLSNADAKRTTVLIHLLLLHHSSIFQNIYVCTYIYFRFTGNIFCGKKKINRSHKCLSSQETSMISMLPEKLD